jgi:hypothetical protein
MPVDLDRDDQVGIWTAHPTLAKGTWKDGDEWYKIRPLSPDILNHFRKMTTKKVRDRTGTEVDHRDDEKYDELLWDHAIEDWRVVNSAGLPWECNLKNKLKLAGKYAERVKWIVDMGIEYANNDVARQDAEDASFRGLPEEENGQPLAGLSRMPEPT